MQKLYGLAAAARRLVRRGALRAAAHLRRARRVRSLRHRGQLGCGPPRGRIRLAPAPPGTRALHLRRPRAAGERLRLRRVPPRQGRRALALALSPMLIQLYEEVVAALHPRALLAARRLPERPVVLGLGKIAAEMCAAVTFSRALLVVPPDRKS